jgi:hypothetical protein
VHTWLGPVLRDCRRSAGSARGAALSGHDGWAAMRPSKRTQPTLRPHPIRGQPVTNYCLVANPDPQIAGAAYGFADMGPWNGGQAE